MQKTEETIFNEALDIFDVQARHEFLDLACSGDVDFRQKIEALLRMFPSGEKLEPTLDGNPYPQPPQDFVAETVGDNIGPYKLLEEIGEGGMGVVYMAEQKHPVRRVVALKIVKPGMDSRQVIARFDTERQALAMMDHQNIARIIDAGMTELGRPYFVMELVRGMPINEFCDQKRLALRERLQLFVQVCKAVQHAHQQGIIHRDLKPSNVLVTMLDVRAVPKVIDFGIAKAFGTQLNDHTQVTGFAQLVGTPRYMSPEQAEMNQLGVDTRSDVYSLGVMLYELLTGTTPFDKNLSKKTNFEELRRLLREQDPPRPSARISTLDAKTLSTISERRGVNPNRIAISVRGELDWIVMKALEKDRERRYESANALASDLQRYLNDDPVLACPPSMSYRLHKYARRHRAQLVAAATIAAILVGATLVSSSLAAWAIQQKGIATSNLIDAQQERENALDARSLAKQQEQLATQQMMLAKRQRDAADYDAYVARIQLVQRDLISGRARAELFAKLTPAPDRPDFRGWEWRYLHSRLHCQKFTLPFQALNSPLAWSPDGQRIATVDAVGRVDIWDRGNGQLKSTLNGCPGKIHSMSWSADGRSLAAGSDRKVVAIWDMDSRNMRLLRGHTDAVKCVDWNMDSLRLASGGDDGNVYVWDSKTGDRVAQYSASSRPVRYLHWHPDGIQLLANIEQEVKIWNSENGSERSSRKREYEFYVKFRPDNEHLAYGCTFSPDGKQLASRCIDGTIRIWDAENGTHLESIPGQSVTSPIAWSPTGRLIASAEDGEVKVWDAGRLGAEVTLAIPGRNALSVAFSPDNGRVLVSAQYGLVSMWDAESHNEVSSIQSGLTWMRSVAWSPDGKQFAASAQSEVRIYDATSGEQQLAIKADGESRSLAWNPNGKTLAIGYRNRRLGIDKGNVRLFNSGSGQELAGSTEIVGAHDYIAWNPDGSRLAAVCLNSCVRIWDNSLNEVHQVFSDEVSCLSWSPDGKYLAIGDSLNKKCTLAIYEGSDWKLLRNFSLNDGDVAAIVWHPHLSNIASGHSDGTVRIWDCLTGRELLSLEAHKGSSNSVAWSRDGMRLASSGDDGSVRIWDASSADVYFKRHGELRDQATNYVRKQKYLEAIEVLDRLQQLHPDERELVKWKQNVRWLVAMALAVDGKLDDAIAIFKQLDNEDANLPDYRLRLSGELFAAEKYDQAFALAESFAAEFPEKREFRDELAFLLESRVTQLCRLGQFAEAETILRKLGEGYPDRVDNRAELAFEMARTGSLEETVAMLARLAQAFEAFADYRPTLARRLADADDHELAAAIYEQLVADYPDSPEYQLQRDFESAHVLITAGQLDDAIAIVRQLEQESSNDSVQRLLGQALLARGRSFVEKGELDQAIVDFSDAFERLDHVSKSTAGYHLALTQVAAGKVEDYCSTCARMIEQFEDSQESQNANWLAWSCALAPDATSDYSIPITASEVALRSDPKSVQYLRTLGAVLYRAGQFDQANSVLTQAKDLSDAEIVSSSAYTYFFLAMTFYALQRPDEAQQWQTQANALALDELAVETLPWNRKLTLQILRVEVAELLGNIVGTD